MNKYFKDFPKWNLLMLGLCVIAILSFIVSKNWNAACWSFNTAVWCLIQGMDQSLIEELRKN